MTSEIESPLHWFRPSLAHPQEHPDLVVGVDICGDPHQPTVTPFLLPALKVGDGGGLSVWGRHWGGRYWCQHADLIGVKMEKDGVIDLFGNERDLLKYQPVS